MNWEIKWMEKGMEEKGWKRVPGRSGRALRLGSLPVGSLTLWLSLLQSGWWISCVCDVACCTAQSPPGLLRCLFF